MAGTLLRLKDAGCEIHLWNLANGCCGSGKLSRGETAAVRWEEAQASAAMAGGTAHPPLFDDLGIFYDASSLAKTAAVIRLIQPDIILTHSPQDYMEDHQNTARLAVTGVFMRGMKNAETVPPVASCGKLAAVYHALPHGLRDSLRQPVEPDFYTDITSVLARKRALLHAFGSAKGVSRAAVADLVKVEGINQPLAERIYGFFRPSS